MGDMAVFFWEKRGGDKMAMRVFTVFDGYITRLQRKIIIFMNEQAKIRNKPITQRCIVIGLSKDGIPVTTIRASVRSLEEKGYIRKAVDYESRASYVIQRTA